MRLPEWSAISRFLTLVSTNHLVWAALCVFWGILTLVSPSSQFGKFSAFTVGMCFTGAIYNILIRKMLQHQCWLREQLQIRQDMMLAMMQMRTHDIGRSIAEHVNSAIKVDMDGLGNGSTTKH